MNLEIRRLETDSVESEIPTANKGLKTTGTKFKNLGRRNEEILSRFWLSSWASTVRGETCEWLFSFALIKADARVGKSLCDVV